MLLTLLTLPATAQERGEAARAAQLQAWARADAAGVLDDECPDFTNRRDAILNGNKITSQIFNFGSISAPGNTITDIVWNGLGYGYEFGPFVAAEVVDDYKARGASEPFELSVPLLDDNGNPVLDSDGDPVYVMHIVSDGLTSNGGEVIQGRFNGWQPIPCAQPVGGFEGLQVVNPASNKIPTSDAEDANLDGRPDSWPEAWYNEGLGDYVWPGALQQGASNADKEALYFMNDYANREFPYYPFPSDTTRRGLGLETEVRMYQWANPLAEDVIFLIYKITNKSEKDLDKVIFGMWGDPHIGGPSNWQDDLANFDKDLNMVFAWDDDGISDVPGRQPGYFGYKFLESPGVGVEIINGQRFPGDGIDNDGDGLIDESWTDGIDNDGDWDPELDDVGVDGVAGTGDQGEGDGRPTAGSQFDITKPGEPNFEFTDIDESDQIGLTSFRSPPFAGTRISDDEGTWARVAPDSFDTVPESPGDYVFIYGSGSFRLRAGETKRFSIALILGESREDLTLNAQTAQQIYNAGYVFAKPPIKPVVRAVPGDKKVTLYWDDAAEGSVDPLTRERDFEGYVIYRSTDHEFSDIQGITDINGSRFLYEPLETEQGVEAKFDLDNGLRGPAPVPYPNRGIAYDLGDDTGLFHTFVDSNNVINGQRYFYTVVAYDRGYTEASDLFLNGIPPTETTKTVTYDPTTDAYVFDVNTVSVVPGPRVAGYVEPTLGEGVERASGFGTGGLDLRIVDELAVKDNTYRIDFDTLDGETIYSVIDEATQRVELPAFPNRFSALGFRNILPSTFALQTADGRTLSAGTDYELNERLGAVQVLPASGIERGTPLVATFQYAPVYQSSRLALEESNPIFDGIQLFVDDDVLRLDESQTGWIEGGGTPFSVRVSDVGQGGTATPSDYEITFTNEPVSESFGNGLPLPFRIVNVTQGNAPVTAFVPDANRNGQWDPTPNEKIAFLEDLNGDGTLTNRELTWQVSFDGAQPGNGDVFYIRTFKPFGPRDAFTLTTQSATADEALVADQLDEIYVVPNPYIARSVFEPRNPVSRTQRGERRLYFANVPAQCTIRIYTLAGELVDTIVHDTGLDGGKAFWDLRTKDNLSIAYGLYLFHVESDAGTHIGKFAIIK